MRFGLTYFNEDKSMGLLCAEFSVIAVNQVVELAIKPKVLVSHMPEPIADAWLAVHPCAVGACS